SYFSFVMRRPAAATLFPYTTLFRSLPGRFGDIGDIRVQKAQAGVKNLIEDCKGLCSTGASFVQLHLGAFDIPVSKVAPEELVNLDRKSTRLNSSHVKISYAVFCLKK